MRVERLHAVRLVLMLSGFCGRLNAVIRLFLWSIAKNGGLSGVGEKFLGSVFNF